MLVGTMLFSPLARAQSDPDVSTSAPPALPTPTDSVLPRTGIDTAVSDIREHLLQTYGDQVKPTYSGPDWHIDAMFGASEEFTSNVGTQAGGSLNRGSDFITQLQPGISFIDTTQRLQANIAYQPIGQIYARNSDFSQFQQQATGNVLLTALPGWFYVDLRGSISQQSVYGGLGPASTVTLAPDNRETVSSVSVSPYLARSLGGAGTVQLGVGYVYSATDAPNQAGLNPSFAGYGAYGSSYLATKRAFASYTTGENLGRLSNRIGTDDNFYDGGGALAGGRRILVTDDVSYAISRVVTLLGQAGYEDLAYPRSDYFYSGPVGSGGVKLTPNRNSNVTVEYRYVDGFGSAYVQGSAQVTARIRVFGGYSAGISTFEQDTQTMLLDTSNDATGAAATVLQAAPLLGGTNAFSANQNLNRLHRLDATATYLGVVDTVTASVQHETTSPVGRPVGYAPASTSGTFGSLTDSHELTPVMSLNLFVQYGSNRTGLLREGSGDTVSVSVGLNRSFSPTLTGYVRAGGTYVVGGSAFAASGYQGLNGNDTTVIVGGVKRF